MFLPASSRQVLFYTHGLTSSPDDGRRHIAASYSISKISAADTSVQRPEQLINGLYFAIRASFLGES